MNSLRTRIYSSAFLNVKLTDLRLGSQRFSMFWLCLSLVKNKYFSGWDLSVFHLASLFIFLFTNNMSQQLKSLEGKGEKWDSVLLRFYFHLVGVYSAGKHTEKAIQAELQILNGVIKLLWGFPQQDGLWDLRESLFSCIVRRNTSP